MKRTIEIERVDAKKATDEQVAALALLNNEVFREFHPDDPPLTPQELAAYYRSLGKFDLKDIWVAIAGGRTVGASIYGRDTEDNVHLGWVTAFVAPDHRNRGLGKELLGHAIESARAEGRSLLTASTKDGTSYGAFAEKMGFTRSREKGRDTHLTGYENRLDLRQVDRGLLDGWIRRAKERTSDYELIFWDGPTAPDELEAFARVLHVMNTSPMPEGMEDWEFTPEKVSEFENRKAANGYRFWTYAARHRLTGEFVGLTRLFPNPWRPSMAYQDDTGVDPAHRNRGLGRWLKAAMLVRLLTELPETRVVSTHNATSNAAMLSINDALGFRPYITWLEWMRDLG